MEKKSLEVSYLGSYIIDALDLPEDDDGWIAPHLPTNTDPICGICDEIDRLYEVPEKRTYVSLPNYLKLPDSGSGLFLNEDEMELVDELVNIIQTAQRLSDRYGDILDRLKMNKREEEKR
uniref:Uncharacterized protein n=1 Tax=Marseillevirus LCMAC102 TaxID=2506603 RepID=A0A481YTV3_9VIRU|nr:MAG: hypothetical protein LCMAC102_01620 [Marseillevirus LCMAC102]